MRDKNLIIILYILIFFVFIIFMWTVLVKLPDVQQKVTFTKRILIRDWHDYQAMALDLKRVGIGEQGKKAYIKEQTLKKQEEEKYLENGYNALLSDAISVNRSLPDLRNKGCHAKRYLAKLPNVSIIIPFYNEHFSVLIRSVHSLVNRSPSELLQEIILIDDGSNRKSLLEQLDHYAAKHFPQLKVIRLKRRLGLIGARLAGARLAKAKVLIFLDAHIEATNNWLPPLLEPIALNKRTTVCPFIDVIDDKTFQYTIQDNGARGAFNWIFDYKRLPLLTENLIDRTLPFESPVMAGGLFAISADFFWELGGYDKGLDIWGGEQYELSFKIWMCGGTLLDAPCSHVGHIYRGERKAEPNPRGGDDYVRRNYKRVAEVWMDEYKHYLYAHDDSYKEIDPGDLTQQKNLRNKLKCKSFKWFIENIAFDLVKHFPPIEQPDYANGVIQSVADPELCIDTLNNDFHSLVGLFTCSDNKTHPQHNQKWALSGHRDIRIRPELICLRVKESKANASVWLWECQEEGGDQFWYYDFKRQLIVFERNGTFCLEAVPQTHSLRINKCQNRNMNMKWKFGYVNTTALKSFFNDIPDISYAL